MVGVNLFEELTYLLNLFARHLRSDASCRKGF
jgi:hypothetical protein